LPPEFGIIEAREGATLPVTVRAIEPDLVGKASHVTGQMVRLQASDAEIADWLRRLDKAEQYLLKSLELAPDNADVKKGLEKLRSMR